MPRTVCFSANSAGGINVEATGEFDVRDLLEEADMRARRAARADDTNAQRIHSPLIGAPTCRRFF
jgi:hypothetical protein